MTKVTQELNALREKNVEAFRARAPSHVLEHFMRIAALKRRIGTASATNFAVLRVCLAAVFVVVLWWPSTSTT